ncbi:thioesterase-like superfamily-domain-containing protein [Gloeopeniophorella convolvens]|nr:thioesterase-like superfamily-domain-containing protein [Gloeopeniophorella convolvens]
MYRARLDILSQRVHPRLQYADPSHSSLNPASFSPSRSTTSSAMAPFNQASGAKYLSTSDDGTKIFGATADPVWTVGKVPHGGYILGIMIEAAAQYQAKSAHKDPLHATVHYLRAISTTAPFEVSVKTIRRGQGFTNLTAEAFQKGVLKITSHLVFGVLEGGAAPGATPLVLRRPDPRARQTPFQTPPSQTEPLKFQDIASFSNEIIWSRDNTIQGHHEELVRADEGPGGAEDGRYYELYPGQAVTPAFLSFVCDSFPGLLPYPAGLKKVSWFPTVSMSLEFKTPIPRGTRTVGVFGASRFIEEPLGRHDFYAEVWTVPDNITDKGSKLPENWRDEQRCLLVATQFAMVMQFPDSPSNGKQSSQGAKESKL